MMNRFLFVANWKMNMTFSNALEFGATHRDALISLSKQYTCDVVICPSFPALYPLAQLFNQTPILLGAQNCSAYAHGAYTGEVDALSLAQVGCTYTIVGHSERRNYFNENNEVVGKKIVRLLEQQITPIVCIGETKNEYEQDLTFPILNEQLTSIIAIIKQHKPKTPIVIAYEPIWAIGTGITPHQSYLMEVSQWIHDQMQAVSQDYRLLYGGSVDAKNIEMISSIANIHGFLIGGASLDFQKLQNIVSLTYSHTPAL